MNTLFYLVYGGPMYVAEATYSLLSAYAYVPPEDGRIRYVVYTDQPEEFAALKVEVVPLSDEMLRNWRGEWGFNHRGKMCAMADALTRFPGSVALVDTDTYFRKSPLTLFGRIGPGRSVMHVAEGRFSELRSPELTHLQEFLSRGTVHNAGDLRFAKDEVMWNSGVVGTHSDDAHAIADAIALLDAIQAEPALRNKHHNEQYAFGHCLARDTRLASAIDIVFHYWLHDLKTPFRAALPGLIANSRMADLRAWGRKASQGRPVASPVRQLKMTVRAGLRALGVSVPGWRASA